MRIWIFFLDGPRSEWGFDWILTPEHLFFYTMVFFPSYSTFCVFCSELRRRCGELEREVLDLDRTNRDLLHAADETRNELSETRKSEDQIKRLEAAMAAEKAEAAQERTRNNTAHGQCRVKFVGVRNSIWNRQGVGYFSEPD